MRPVTCNLAACPVSSNATLASIMTYMHTCRHSWIDTNRILCRLHAVHMYDTNGQQPPLFAIHCPTFRILWHSLWLQPVCNRVAGQASAATSGHQDNTMTTFSCHPTENLHGRRNIFEEQTHIVRRLISFRTAFKIDYNNYRRLTHLAGKMTRWSILRHKWTILVPANSEIAYTAHWCRVLPWWNQYRWLRHISRHFRHHGSNSLTLNHRKFAEL